MVISSFKFSKYREVARTVSQGASRGSRRWKDNADRIPPPSHSARSRFLGLGRAHCCVETPSSIGRLTDSIRSERRTRASVFVQPAIVNRRINGRANGSRLRECIAVTWRRFTRDAHWGKFMSGITEL